MAMPRTLSLVCLLLTALVACSVVGPQQPDLDQLARLRTADTATQANASIGCTARDRVCAQLMQLHGEACAQRAGNVLGITADERARMLRCAVDAARRLPGLLPADAPPAEQEAAASAIFDGWRAAIDADDPAADPASLAMAASNLHAIPGGAPYADTLDAARLIHSAVRGAPADQACGQLARALATLPSSPPPIAGFARRPRAGHRDRCPIDERVPLMAGVFVRPLFLTTPMMRGEDVSAVQTALNARNTVPGAALKIDGVFGQATDAAVRSFQRAAGLGRVDGIVGPETWTALFGAMPAAPDNAAAARTCFTVLREKWSVEQACGILGNIQRESGFKPAAKGDGGSAYGLAQWHPPRQAAFQQHFGKPIQGSTLEEQTRFITFEMREGSMSKAGQALLRATTPESAADIVCRKYEIPADKDGESARRAQIARAFFAAFTANPQTAPPAPEPIAPATAEVLNPGMLQAMMVPHAAYPGGVPWALTPSGIEVDGQAPPLQPAAIARVDGLWSRYAARLPVASRVPAELVLALLDLFADRAGAVTVLPGGDTLAPERTPDRVAVGPLQVTLEAARTALGRPGLTLAELADPDLALQAGVQAIALRSGETRYDPPLVAAAHLAGGLFADTSAGNRWRLAQGGPVVLIDRFVTAFNAAMQVTGSRSTAGLTTMHDLLETISAPSAGRTIGPLSCG